MMSTVNNCSLDQSCYASLLPKREHTGTLDLSRIFNLTCCMDGGDCYSLLPPT